MSWFDIIKDGNFDELLARYMPLAHYGSLTFSSGGKIFGFDMFTENPMTRIMGPEISLKVYEDEFQRYSPLEIQTLYNTFKTKQGEIMIDYWIETPPEFKRNVDGEWLIQLFRNTNDKNISFRSPDRYVIDHKGVSKEEFMESLAQLR